jgi:hypothetical protein
MGYSVRSRSLRNVLRLSRSRFALACGRPVLLPSTDGGLGKRFAGPPPACLRGRRRRQNSSHGNSLSSWVGRRFQPLRGKLGRNIRWIVSNTRLDLRINITALKRCSCRPSGEVKPSRTAAGQPLPHWVEIRRSESEVLQANGTLTVRKSSERNANCGECVP